MSQIIEVTLLLFPTQSASEMPEVEVNADALARRKPVNIAFANFLDLPVQRRSN